MTIERTILAAALLAAGAACAHATDIAIANAGFELPPLPPGSSGPFGTGTVPASGWLVAGDGANIFYVTSGSGPFPGGAPEGHDAIALAADTTLSQTLSSTLAKGTYQLSMEIGNPAGRADASATTSYQLFLPVNGRVLASGVTLPMDQMPNGVFELMSVTTTIAADDPGLGQALAIRVRTGDMPFGPTAPFFAVDDVKLSVSTVPEPAEWALCLGGLLGLISWRRARQARDA